MDVESFEEGFLAKIIFGEGQSAPVGATVAVLAKTKDDIAAVQVGTHLSTEGNPPPPPLPSQKSASR
jgi:pyruvate dehydrogenase E2 component (dihydrolipoamide acetyltransferase)